ncbi:hypothetical protein [Limosilactobacillus reuteri]|uniref:hypothetical protein n=1 Tax=Limosilactobacillus reuteri TaxID=1598 RepID=UPI00159EFECD|nr:hypothetical protein [Limosilactobacillus reuteri]MCH5378675.1 hypothetical protein [Limosilactobacillus reuteri]
MDWQKLVLKYRNRTISEFLVVFLDGARFMTLTPNLGSINPLSDNLLTFQYFIADTLEYTVERLFLSMKQGPTAPDGLQKFNLFQRVVVFENKNQKDQVLDELSGKPDYIEEQCNPTQEEIDRCRSLLKMDFNVNTVLKLSDISCLKMFFFTGLNAVLYVVPFNLLVDMIYQIL